MLLCRGRTVLITRDARLPLSMQRESPLLVDPEVSSRADEIRFRVLEIAIDLAEQAEHAQQRVLHQVLAVPDVAGQPAAVAVQGRPEWREGVEIAPPRTAYVGLNCEGGVGVGVRHVCHLAGSLTLTIDGFERIRRRSLRDD